ncbi:MAG: OmpH family outer membrane protein [Alphaproteobacteria bacterium]|nr:OmpH family outer membrane protein [Alphaproteobacteria bacterium]
MASAMFWMAVFFMPLPAMAQDAGERFSVQRVAVIDLARIIRESEATERVRALLDTKSEEFQKEFAEKEVQLLAKEKELKARQSLISEEAYQEEVRAFQREVAAVQQDIQNKRQSLDRALQQAQDKIRQLATTIVTERASALNIDLVFKEEQLLIFRNQLNITDDVLERLNIRTKDAQLEISEPTKTKSE